MQSYQLHIVSEHLRHRHPYLEPPFKARYDSTEVTPLPSRSTRLSSIGPSPNLSKSSSPRTSPPTDTPVLSSPSTK